MRQIAITKPSNQPGFTLLEVLVVITIIGILVGVTVLSFGAADQRRLSAEAGRLMLAFNQATDAAMMKQMTLGWFYQPEEKQYFFRQLAENGTWLTLNNQIFEKHLVNAPVELSIEEPIQRRKQTKILLRTLDDQQENPLQPQLLFLSSGEYTPFSIEVADTRRSPIGIRGDGFSNIVSSVVR